MQLIQICPSYKPAYQYGGPTISISMLCEKLQTSTLKPLVLTTTGNGNEELQVLCKTISIVDGVSVQYFKRLTKDHSHFSPSLCLHLIQHIRTAKKSRNHLVIHIHSWWNLVALLSCFIARIYKIPTIISPRGMLTDYTFVHNKEFVKSCIHILFGKWLLEGCHLHATSEKEKQDISSFLKPKSVTVIPNILSFPSIQFDQHRPVQAKTFKFLFFSRIDEKKGIELLLKAAAKLNFNYHLTIAGSGKTTYVSKLQTLSTSLDIAQNISWLGHVSTGDKYKELTKHDLLVLPSYNENFANVVIESLSVGTAVLISDQVGLASYILSSNLGWVSKLNTNDLAAHITRISKSKATLTRIRTSAPRQIADEFNSDKLLKQYVDFYNTLMPSVQLTKHP
jgi:glycosyltransferase involved in cell wall biosynthesis